MRLREDGKVSPSISPGHLGRKSAVANLKKENFLQETCES